MSRFRNALTSLLVLLLLLTAFGPAFEVTSAQADGPSIRITRRNCDNTTYPVFVESHCLEDTTAQFRLDAPAQGGNTTITSGVSQVVSSDFVNGQPWQISDVNTGSVTPLSVLSCLEKSRTSGMMLGVAETTSAGVTGGWSITWETVTDSAGTYAPDLVCIWFSLPNLSGTPAVVSLQAAEAQTPYVTTTSAAHPPLGDFERGFTGEDFETGIVMTENRNGLVYSFAADQYGQVLVPAGTYNVVSSDSGIAVNQDMDPGKTVLVDIGVAPTTADGNAGQSPAIEPSTGTGIQPSGNTGTGSSTGTALEPSSGTTAGPTATDVPSWMPVDGEVGSWAVGVMSCEGDSCTALSGVVVYYESEDGSISGNCTTEAVDMFGTTFGMCNFDFIWGQTVTLTLHEPSLPPGAYVAENPMVYTVQPNLGGDPHIPMFSVDLP